MPGGQSARLETVRAGGGVFHLQYWPEDAQVAKQVKLTLGRSAAGAERWGAFSSPVLVTIHPTHEALEVATHREGQGWMLAWSRYASVDLQSPRTWSATDTELEQLLTHELTHCVMYQSVASQWTWQKRLIPLWFREGMASVTAGQEHKRVAPGAITLFYSRKAAGESARSAGDPLTEPEPLYHSDPDLVYATADRAFHFLLERHGEERVRKLIASMGAGNGFRYAFRNAVGISLQEFEDAFRRSVAGREGMGVTARLSTPPSGARLVSDHVQGTASPRP